MARALISRCRRDVRGIVMLEFLIAFMPVLLLFLGTVQLVMLYVADLVIQHAAVSGARSACVVLNDDAKYYAGEPLGALNEDGGSADFTAPLGIFGVDTNTSVPALPTSAKRPGPRLAAIRRALSLPLAAIAPTPEVLARLFAGPHSSLGNELGATPATRIASAFLLYDALALAVTFPASPGAELLNTSSVPSAGEVTVRATYLFHCGVPLAAALLCSSFKALTKTKALHELDHAPNAAAHPLLLASSARFRVLRAEATLPGQYASYSARPARAKEAP